MCTDFRRDFEACAPVLRKMEVVGDRSVRERLAAVWWLLMKELPPSDCVEYEDGDLQILLNQDSIKIEMDKGKEGGEERNNNLLEKVCPAFLFCPLAIVVPPESFN